MQVLSVSQLNRYVKSVLEEDRKLSSLFLKGEISNFVNHYRSGHFYLTLKDEQAAVKAVMFKRSAGLLAFLPEDGMEVIARGSVSLYERDGSFQFYVTDLIPSGEGAAAIAVRQRKERLEKLGVFDPARKKPLPPFPETIGVITSDTGAAIADILRVLEYRNPTVKVLFAPAQVQGAGAPASLIAALKLLDGRCDLIIIGRGGGSSEDLSAFQDESLAMQIFHTVTPVISSVGHEVDVTICDLAADLRAPTPSAAAEMAVPDLEELLFTVSSLRKSLNRIAARFLSDWERRYLAAAKSQMMKNPKKLIKIQTERLSFLHQSLYNEKDTFLNARQERIGRNAALLESLSPLSVLSRGYGIVFKDERAVGSVTELSVGDSVQIRMRDGIVMANVGKITEGIWNETKKTDV